VPRRQLFAIPRIAIALVLTLGCAGGKDSKNPTSPGNTQGTVNGGWSGTTSQGRTIDFLVDNGNVSLTMISTSVTAGTCVTTLTTFISSVFRGTSYPVSSGAFTTSTSGTGGSLTVSGTLNTAGTGTGTVAVNDVKCATTFNGTWTATKSAAPLVSLTGTWNANFASSAQTSRVNGQMVLTQNGSAITGTYTTVSGGVGTVTGSVFGRLFMFSLNQTTQGCTGSFTGNGAIMPSPELMVYYYTGSDCLGTHSAGNGTGSR
jgi:hypothetical protein